MNPVHKLAVSAVLLSTSGCMLAALVAVSAVAIGAVKYDENEAYRDFRAEVPATWDAALASVKKIYGVKEVDRQTVERGKRELDHGEVWLRVARHPDEADITRVTVRIGTFDTKEHRAKAGRILEEVAKRIEGA